jgi:predicted peptidase
MKNMLVWLLCLLILHFSYPIMSQTQEKYPDFSREIYLSKGDSLPYRLLKPRDYDPSKSYPLVIFYHGAGERGTDNEITLAHFAHFLTSQEARQDFPCFAIVPQCSKDIRWVEVDWSALSHTQPTKPSRPLEMSLELIETLQKEYTLDSTRFYVTGLSMGGFATWDVITRYPDLFAAAAPICGGGDEKVAYKVKDLPIWAFHGDKDGVVKPSRSRNMIQALKNVGTQPKYTEYKGVGHDSWKPAYKEAELLKWLFSQKKQ